MLGRLRVIGGNEGYGDGAEVMIEKVHIFHLRNGLEMENMTIFAKSRKMHKYACLCLSGV